jgi:hypothetical protein
MGRAGGADRRRQRCPGRLPSWTMWIGLSGAAEAVGMTAAALAAKTGSATGVPPATALALVVAGGLVEGIALGVAQAVGLRGLLARSVRRAWVLTTVLVAGLGWAAASAPAALNPGDGSRPPVALAMGGAVALGAVMGTLLGAAQACVLRGAVPHPWRWVGANAAAWPLAMPVIFLGAMSPSADWSILAVAALGTGTGLAAGAVLGAVTGRFLPSVCGLRGRPPPTPAGDPEANSLHPAAEA